MEKIESFVVSGMNTAGVSSVGGASWTFTVSTPRWKFCPDCGTKLEGAWKFCADCGKRIESMPFSTTPMYPLHSDYNIPAGYTRCAFDGLPPGVYGLHCSCPKCSPQCGIPADVGNVAFLSSGGQ